MNLSNLLMKLGLSSVWVQDVTLLLVIIFFSFILGMFIGRQKLAYILVSSYIALAVAGSIPEKIFSDYLYNLITFFALVIILTLLGRKFLEIHISGMGHLWKVFLLSFFEVVLLISIALMAIPKKLALEYVSASSFEYLASPNWHFFWIIAPIIFLFFAQKRAGK